MVGEALKGGRLIAKVMEVEGYRVHLPTSMPASPSFITPVEVGSRDRMVAFCKAVQRASPVGSYIEPTPGNHSDQCRECLQSTHKPSSLLCLGISHQDITEIPC